MKLILVVMFMLISVTANCYDEAVIPQINIYQGEDFSQVWQLKGCIAYNKYGVCTTIVPVDITGSTIKASAKIKLSDTVPFVNFSTSVFNGYSGAIKISLSHNQTINFNTIQNAYFDMYIKYPNGSIQYLLKSNLVTRPTATH